MNRIYDDPVFLVLIGTLLMIAVLSVTVRSLREGWLAYFRYFHAVHRENQQLETRLLACVTMLAGVPVKGRLNFSSLDGDVVFMLEDLLEQWSLYGPQLLRGHTVRIEPYGLRFKRHPLGVLDIILVQTTDKGTSRDAFLGQIRLMPGHPA